MAEKMSQKAKRALAARARAREEHARMMIARQGDPSLVQQTRTATGRTIHLTPDVADTLRPLLESQREAFVRKFGREPGPEDPVFFDQTSATPTFLREEDLHADAALTTEAHRRDIGPDGMAIVTAWQELGYIVTEATKHLFSAHEVCLLYTSPSPRDGL